MIDNATFNMKKKLKEELKGIKPFIPFGVYRTLQSQIGRNEFESAEKGINGLKRRIQYAVEENAIEYDEY